MLVLVNFAEVKVCLTREYCKYVTFGALNASHKRYLSIPLPLQSYGSVTTAIVILCYFILVKNRILVWGHKFFLRQICQIQPPSSAHWPCSLYVVTCKKQDVLLMCQIHIWPASLPDFASLAAVIYWVAPSDRKLNKLFALPHLLCYILQENYQNNTWKLSEEYCHVSFQKAAVHGAGVLPSNKFFLPRCCYTDRKVYVVVVGFHIFLRLY